MSHGGSPPLCKESTGGWGLGGRLGQGRGWALGAGGCGVWRVLVRGDRRNRRLRSGSCRCVGCDPESLDLEVVAQPELHHEGHAHGVEQVVGISAGEMLF